MRNRKPARGYAGSVTLVSPSGEMRELKLPGRRFGFGKPEIRAKNAALQFQYAQRDTEFYRLLSLGWKVAEVRGPKDSDSPPRCGSSRRPFAPKQTEEVDGSTQTGKETHGGERASGEVENSLNAFEQGENESADAEDSQTQSNPSGDQEGGDEASQRAGELGGDEPKQKYARRGTRGRKRGFHRTNEGTGEDRDLRPILVYHPTHQRNVPVISPQELDVDEAVVIAARESAKLFAQLVGGMSSKHAEEDRGINIQRFVVARAINDDPVPPLEWRKERPTFRVLISPDISGSCSFWSGVSQAWAMEVATLPDIEVVYATNYNGEWWPKRPVERELQSTDLLVYLGDSDGIRDCKCLARQGLTILALSVRCSRLDGIRLVDERLGTGRLLLAERVSPKKPDTWTEALRLVLARL